MSPRSPRAADAANGHVTRDVVVPDLVDLRLGAHTVFGREFNLFNPLRRDSPGRPATFVASGGRRAKRKTQSLDPTAFTHLKRRTDPFPSLLSRPRGSTCRSRGTRPRERSGWRWRACRLAGPE